VCDVDVNIAGATLAPLINSINPSFCLDEKWVQIIVAGAILFPLSSMRSMAMFRFTGFAAFLCIMFVMVSIIIGGARAIITEGSTIMDGITIADFSFNSIFSALPVVSFAYVFHASFFPIWESMSDGSSSKITAATSVALGFVAVVYMAIGSFGYLSFKTSTDNNVMENYPASDILMVVAKVGYLLVVCAAYPINCFVLRTSIDRLIFRTQPAPWWRGVIEAFLLVALSTLLAIVLPNISLILGVAGALPGSFLAFIFPALFYIILVDNSATGVRWVAAICSGPFFDVIIPFLTAFSPSPPFTCR
jgi:solute carrier family 38 (sodium-coupled neutral amino acid transporter), member 11